MADIIDPEAVKFVNEQVRPLCEAIRNLHLRMSDASALWQAGTNAKIPNDSSPLVDGRENEGVSRLTGEDINSAVSAMASVLTLLNAAGVMDIVRKPCVRALAVLGE